MDTKTQHGCLLLADISGYTSYVAQTELEHSQEVLSELLELLLAYLTPALTLAKLEGDAVFVYAPDQRLSRAETVLDLIETAYVAFRDRLEGIRVRTTCDCNACRAIPVLDLKFIVHHGDYIMQNVAGIAELAGSDVNLAHRLLKNHVADVTGWRGYALFSEQFMAQLAAPLEHLHEQSETYEHLGVVRTYAMNLRDRYAELNAARHVFVTAGEADVALTYDFDQPAPVVWEWLNDPQKRTLWMKERVWQADTRPGGRTAVGARNHCSHGKDTLAEVILDWKPFSYVTARQDSKQVHLVETVSLEPLAAGQRTLLRDHIKVESSLPPPVRRALFGLIITRLVKYKNKEVFANLARLMAAAGDPGAAPPA